MVNWKKFHHLEMGGWEAGMITAVTKRRNDIEEEDLGGEEEEEEEEGVMLCEWQSRVLSQSRHVAGTTERLREIGIARPRPLVRIHS